MSENRLRVNAGKGDDPRPVNKSEFDKNYDAINWCKHTWASCMDAFPLNQLPSLKKQEFCTLCGVIRKID